MNADNNLEPLRAEEPGEWPVIRAFLCAEWHRNPERLGRHMLDTARETEGALPEFALSPFHLFQVIAGACAPACVECRFLCRVAAAVWMEQQVSRIKLARFLREVSVQTYSS
jgi:hypothetical protein